MLREIALDRIILALDFDSPEKALGFAKDVKKEFPGVKVKIGKQLFTKAGPDIIRRLISEGLKVFLDLKDHDIPKAVAQAGVEAADLGVSMFSLHASGGYEMMKMTVEEVNSLKLKERPKIIAVTILTTIDQAILNATLGFIGATASTTRVDRQAMVVHLAQLAKSAGCDGVFCPVPEIEEIKRVCGRGFITVSSGIRSAGKEKHDQKITGTPLQAIKDGSDFIVIGRQVTEAKDAIAAMNELVGEVVQGLRLELALDLYRFGCIQFGNFKLKMHDQFPDAPLSPIYVDLRRLRSLEIKKQVAYVFAEMINRLQLKPTKIADAPESISPIVAILSMITGIPQITPRLSTKGHGIGARVEGVIEERDSAVLFDDVVTSGMTKNEIIEVLEQNEPPVRPEAIIVLVDREQGGQAKVPIHSYFKISELLEIYRGEGLIDQGVIDRIRNYQKATEEFLRDKKP